MEGEFAQLAESFSEMVLKVRSSQKRLVTTERIAAWQSMARKIAHNGDATMRQHVMNAAAVGVEERWIRFKQKADGLPIDALVAASMAVCTISRLNLG